jgi:glycosyltransferase involved in cell wall biosynthesis
MLDNGEKNNGPLVTVVIPTFNRPQYLHEALSSVVCQSYKNLQIIVANDGGMDVSDIIHAFNDPRIVFINRKVNRGLPYTLNEALSRATGQYICYLGDDDRYFSHHVGTLVNALENQTDCQVAYSDLYKVYCKVQADGGRQVLSKVVEVSRDFDRFLMLQFNHALHVALMHRRDLLEKIGPYNENLNVLIDWDLNRRLVFFSDFYHVYKITGEYYHPMGDCDRISVQRRKDKNEYLRNVLTIRTTRPPKPWTKIKDLSIIFVTDRLDKRAGKTIGSIWNHTFYPYKLYLPMSESDFDRLNTDMPNLVFVTVDAASSMELQVDAALEKCEGEYIAIVPSGFPIRDMWIENSLYALIHCINDRQGFLMEQATDELWAAVVRKDHLQSARRSFPDLSVADSLAAAGMTLRCPHIEEFPFQLDNLLHHALSLEKDGDWSEAAKIYESIADRHQNVLWMKSLAAKAFFKTGKYGRARDLFHEINQQRPTIQNLLMEAKIERENKQFDSAIQLLTVAAHTLEGHKLIWT